VIREPVLMARTRSARLALAAVGIVAACGSGPAAGSHVEGDCDPGVSVAGHVLRERLVHLREDLPPATGSRALPFGCEPDPPTSTFTERRGIPATVALFAAREPARRGADARIWIASDSFPAIAGHPLHRAVYGSARLPDSVDQRRCRPVAVRGTVTLVQAEEVVVVPGRRVVLVEAASRLTGRRAAGIARVAPGDRVAGSAWRCPDTARLVARRLSVAPPR
jgi:hypothetical protein